MAKHGLEGRDGKWQKKKPHDEEESERVDEESDAHEDEGREPVRFPKSQRLNMLERQIKHKIAELYAMDVGEIYSPERVNQYAEQFGLKKGWSLDLTTKDENGSEWDFTKLELRNKATRKVIEDQTLFVIGSPSCTYFSQIMKLSWNRMDQEEPEKKW